MALSGPMLGAVIFASIVIASPLIGFVGYKVIQAMKNRGTAAPPYAAPHAHKAATSLSPVNLPAVNHRGTPTPFTQAGYPTSINPNVNRYTVKRASAGLGNSTAAHIARDY